MEDQNLLTEYKRKDIGTVGAHLFPKTVFTNMKKEFRVCKRGTCFTDDDAFVLSSTGTLYEISDGELGRVGDDWEVCFSTGLLDKNGKKIFEGDIVAEDMGVLGDVTETGNVTEENCRKDAIDIRVEKGFKFKNADKSRGDRYFGRRIKTVKWQDEMTGFYPFADSSENCGCCGGGYNSKNLEIIGNIYENSDLLK